MADFKNNTGIDNTGYRNTGNLNTGDRNTGYRNTGDRNTGNRNTGNRNTGNRNTGNRNTGDRNTGNLNTGDRNTGYRNTGNRNTGNRNTGNRNTGNRNTGYLNTDTAKIRIFGVQTELEYGSIEFPTWMYFDTVHWIYADEMTDSEKKDNPLYGITDGYLKKLSNKVDKNEYMKDCWRLAFDNADKEDVAKTLLLPHFTYEKFEEISGISRADFDKKIGNAPDIDDTEELTIEEIQKRLGKKIKIVE